MPQSPLTLSFGFINAFLEAAEVAGKDAKPLLRQADIPDEVLHETAGLVTGEQFATLYRLIAAKLDDELPNLLTRPLRGGAMKFALLSIINPMQKAGRRTYLLQTGKGCAKARSGHRQTE